jgi:hypothetical protein
MVLILFKNKTFRILDSISVFKYNFVSWAQSIELVSISGVLDKNRTMDNVQKQYLY